MGVNMDIVVWNLSFFFCHKDNSNCLEDPSSCKTRGWGESAEPGYIPYSDLEENYNWMYRALLVKQNKMFILKPVLCARIKLNGNIELGEILAMCSKGREALI